VRNLEVTFRSLGGGSKEKMHIYQTIPSCTCSTAVASPFHNVCL